MAEFTPEKCKQIALARLDVVHQWLEFRKKSKNKLQADYDFVKELMHYYNFKIIACGRHVRAKNVYYPYILPPGIKGKDEFLEFIDGNGFKVVPFSSPGVFRIYPQYKENAK